MSIPTLLSGISPLALRLPQPTFAPDDEGAGGGEAAAGEGSEGEAEAAEGAAGEGAEAEGAAEGAEGAEGEGEGGNESDNAEIEYEGTRYEVPKALASAVMMHKDYTQKTMELGEVRRSVDADKATIATQRQQVQEAQQFVQHFAKEVASIESLNEQIKAYEGVDFIAWGRQNGEEARQHQIARDEMIRRRDGMMMNLQGAVSQAQTKQQEAMRAREASAETEIRKTIKDWGPQKIADFTDFASKAYGFTPAELTVMKLDPRVARALNDLKTLHTAKAKAKPAQVVVEPQPVVRVGGSAKAVAKNPENMTGDEYQTWYYGQQAKKRA